LNPGERAHVGRCISRVYSRAQDVGKLMRNEHLKVDMVGCAVAATAFWGIIFASTAGA
jgi:hypothetical protein